MKIGDIRKKIKKNKFAYFTFRKLVDRDYKSGFKEFSGYNGSKSAETIKREISLVKNYWNCNPMQYYRYRLFDKALSDDELLDYIPSYYFYNYYMPSIYDKIDLSITENKIGMYEYFTNKNIDTPGNIAIIIKGEIYGAPDRKITFDELRSRLLQSEAAIFFVKPDDGQGGNGIFTIKKIDDQLKIAGEILDEEFFGRKIKNNDFVLQEGISQRSDISAINQSSVNTLRVITQMINNEARISAVVLRVGRNGSYVDNSAQGGVSVNIDIDSGMFNKYAFTEHTNEKFDKHPDSGFVFEGFVIRDWENIRLDILDFAAKASEYPEVAWDIAILENKVTVIEINTYYGIEHLQCCIGGMRRKLNVYPG